MLVYRIERQKYLHEVFHGRGAALSRGNRWNSFNTPMVYTSASKSLALLEIMAHIDLFEDLPDDRYILEIEIPDSILIQELRIELLPAGWETFPPGNSTRLIGDEFVRNRLAAVMKVPSSLLKGEFNYLLNPLHESMSSVRLVTAESLDLQRWRKKDSSVGSC
jgi:RES domain-containing protein